MRAHAIDTVWMGHQRDDQLETHLLRHNGGMRAVARIVGGWRAEDWEERGVVRPLLGFAKDRLVATCEARGLPYVVDPTNEDAKYARRNELRAEMRALDERLRVGEGWVQPGGDEAAGAVAALHRSLAKFNSHKSQPHSSDHLAQFAQPHPSSPLGLLLRPSRLPPSLPPAATRALLRTAIHHVAPESASLSSAALEHTRVRLCGLGPLDYRLRPFTPGAGVLVSPAQASEPAVWRLERQPARMGDHRGLELAEGQGALWDGRVWCKIEREGGVFSGGALRVHEVQDGLGVVVQGRDRGRIRVESEREGAWRDGELGLVLRWRRKVWGAESGGWADVVSCNRLV